MGVGIDVGTEVGVVVDEGFSTGSEMAVAGSESSVSILSSEGCSVLRFIFESKDSAGISS